MECIFKKGDRAIVFNSKEWEKTRDLPEGNEVYYQKATVFNVRKRNSKYGSEWLADVKFDSGLISHGHFQRCMKQLNPNINQ